MIRYQLFLLLFVFPLFLQAQNENGENDDDGFEWEGEFDSWKDDVGFDDSTHARTHWAGADLAVTGFLTPANKFAMTAENDDWTLDYSRSIGWNLNLFETRFPIVGPYFGLVTGLGFDWDRYSFEKNVSVQADPGETWAIEDGRDYDVNKLKTTFLRVPLLFELNTAEDPERSFHFAAGVIGGWRIHTKYHQEYSVDGTDITQEKVAKYNVHPFRYSVTTRLGYGKYNIFAEYSPMPLFERGEGPEVYPFSAGITIVGI